MPKVHNPLPQELAQEFSKAASILDHFIKGKNQLDTTLIPPKIIANCKGVAVLTIVKAGFVWSGRAGAGLVVARLPDGRWSAPSAIAAGGAGVGAQIGAEVTDSVFILNSDSAVKAFSIGGNVTFGANLSIAAGPTGRQAEASGAVGHFAPIYAYSKTKGLFAGVSFEGLVILTRKETNARFYGQQVTPAELLSGKIEPPAEAEVLYRSLNHRGFGSKDVEAVSQGNMGSQGSLSRQSLSQQQQQGGPSYAPQQSGPPPATAAAVAGFNNLPAPPPHPSMKQPFHNTPPPPPKPFAAAPPPYMANQQPAPPPKPAHQIYGAQQQQQAIIPPRPKPANQAPPLPPKIQQKIVVALYDFKGERPGDLGFIAGDRITVVEEKEDGWWQGELRGVRGVFPSNYCQQ